MKYDNGLMLDNQADYDTFAHTHGVTYESKWHKVKVKDRRQEGNKERRLGIGSPSKCHFGSEWSATLNTTDVTLQTDISCLI